MINNKSVYEDTSLHCKLVIVFNTFRAIRDTLYLLVLSADKLCKQFGPRPGPTKCLDWSESKLFDSNDVIPERCFQKSWFWKKSADDKKKHEKLPSRQWV